MTPPAAPDLVVGMWVEVLECRLGKVSHVGEVGQVHTSGSSWLMVGRCSPSRWRRLTREEAALLVLAR